MKKNHFLLYLKAKILKLGYSKMSENITNSSPSAHCHLVEGREEVRKGNNTKDSQFSHSDSEAQFLPKLHQPREELPAPLMGRVKENQKESISLTTPSGDDPSKLLPLAERVDDEAQSPEDRPLTLSKKLGLEAKLRERLESLEIKDEACLYSYKRLLENGHYRLLDHLLKIETKEDQDIRNFVKSLSLSEVAHSVLDTQNAIVEYVKAKIPMSRARDVCFILGNRMSGNSTSFCYLCGDTMKMPSNSGYPSFTSEEHPELIHSNKCQFLCTFLPNIREARKAIFVDFPSINHFHGDFISMGKQHALIRLLEIYHPKILLTQSLDDEQLQAVEASRAIFRDLLGEDNLRGSILCLSKNKFNFDPIKHEKEVMEVFKIPTICYLEDLEQPDNRESCFEALDSVERSHSIPKGSKSSYSYHSYCMEEALKFLIAESLKSHKVIWKSKEEFNDEYRKNGIIYAVFSSSHPEVAELLALPEIDSEFVKVLNQYIERFCEREINELIEASDSFIQGGE